jgi:hypothetical protein
MTRRNGPCEPPERWQIQDLFVQERKDCGKSEAHTTRVCQGKQDLRAQAGRVCGEREISLRRFVGMVRTLRGQPISGSTRFHGSELERDLNVLCIDISAKWRPAQNFVNFRNRCE